MSNFMRVRLTVRMQHNCDPINRLGFVGGERGERRANITQSIAFMPCSTNKLICVPQNYTRPDLHPTPLSKNETLINMLGHNLSYTSHL
ncbi:hypothetical protein BX666DRAFT_681184 [Dichotomocladium elegans]|nr:hypothetical protein BX666DRAFT_681184 [Dichotomocladium elegans]